MTKGTQIEHVWMGSRHDLKTDVTVEPYAAACIVFDWEGMHILYALNLGMATSMHDELLGMASATKPRPKTAGERYAANKAKLGFHFRFDDDDVGIFLGGRSASEVELDPDAVAFLSFKSPALGQVITVQFSAATCFEFAKALSASLERHKTELS